MLAIRDVGLTDAHELICAPEDKRWTGVLSHSFKVFLSANNDSPQNFSGVIHVCGSVDGRDCLHTSRALYPRKLPGDKTGMECHRGPFTVYKWN